ncbi:MAG: guanosine monophosphate reductase, partial [Clostridia bacterium]|nr:guanosine monophosphate reductase [Clostridia bacterium]
MQDKRIPDGLTFDDVLLVPQKSLIVPSDVTVNTQLTKTLALN